MTISTFFSKCKGGTTWYHQRILQRGDHRIPPTNFIKTSEIAFNCFKRCKNCWKPFLLSKQCLSTAKNMGMTILIFFYQVQRGDHRIPATSFAKFQKLHSTVSNVLKIVEKHFFHENNVFRLAKACIKISIFFRQVQRGDHRIPPTNFSEFAFNCFKRSKNCWKPFLWSKQCLSTRKSWVWQFQFFLSSAKGGPQDTTNEFCKGGTTGYRQRILSKLQKLHSTASNVAKIVENHFFDQNNVFPLVKTCIKISIFFVKCKGGTTGYHQRIISKFQNLHSTASNVLKIVENHFFDQNNVFPLVKAGYDNFNFFCQVQRGDYRIPPTNFFKISEFAFNCFKRSKNCWKPLLWSKQCLSTRKSWVWQFQFFLSSAKGGPHDTINEFCEGGTTGYRQRILSKLQKLHSTVSNIAKIVENHFFYQNNVFPLLKIWTKQ